MQKEKQRKSNKKAIKRFLYLVVSILILVSLILVIIQFNLFSPVIRLFKKPILINIDDECALIMNQLIHKIKSEGECNINCHYSCNLRNLNFYMVEFTSSDKSCNLCKCYCK